MCAKVYYEQNQNERTFCKYDLSSIPANATITGARLKLTVKTPPTVSRNYEAHWVSNDTWAEGTINWGNQPAPTSLLDTKSTGTTADTQVIWDDVAIKTRVNLERFGVNPEDNDLLSVMTKDAAENSATAYATEFYSREHASHLAFEERPVLEVTYTAPEVCFGDVDEDGDGLVDCDDPDCVGHAACAPTAEICDNGIDDDGDGKIDCCDEDCQPCEICGNGVDDDCDGDADCADSDCADLDPLQLTRFIQEGPLEVPVGTYQCWTIVFKVRANEGMTEVKTQGGFGAHYMVSVPVVTAGNVALHTKAKSTVFIWTIAGMEECDEETLTVEVCTGLNPQKKQEFTSPGIKFLTGQWSSVGTRFVDLDGDGYNDVFKTPYTDRLEVTATP